MSHLRSLAMYGLAGAAASFLLSIVEWIDLSLSLTTVSITSGERLAFSAYSSLNFVSGALVGVLIGLFVAVGSLATSIFERTLIRIVSSARARRVSASVAFGLIAAALLALQPQIRKYILGLLIEAQKLPFLPDDLVHYSAYVVPLIILVLLCSCWMTWLLVHASGSMTGPVVTCWLLAAVGLIIVAYAVDSRYQVQLYEFSLHRSMFLLAQGAAMALVASIYASSQRVRRVCVQAVSPGWRAFVLLVIAIAMLAFTLGHFGRDQRLKALLFTRSTQAKQHFRLAQWALDMDRDGYSSLLGGDDWDDKRSDISPVAHEVFGDGIDNNQMGGDLNQTEAASWLGLVASLRGGRQGIERRRMNIVYVFVDTARADHFGTYGYHRNTTPNLDKLGVRSTVFENAFSPAANTFEATPRFMTSSYWGENIETWTQELTDSGYDTLLFPQQRLFMLKRYVKGARVAPNSDGKPLAESIDAVIDTLTGRPMDKPICAYIYAFDVHAPYKPHDRFNFGSKTVDLYDGELAYTDYHLGRLFDWLEKSGHMTDTMIVIMADHGESLGERRVWRHSSQLYNEQTHVPLILYSPLCPPRRVRDYVSTIDLGTTILDAVGIPCPGGYAGVSLLPLMHGEPFSHPPIFAEQIVREKDFREVRRDESYENPKLKKYMIVTQDGYKLIYTQQYRIFELYDLKTDPGELNNLFDILPAISGELMLELGRFIDLSSTSDAPINEDVKEAAED